MSNTPEDLTRRLNNGVARFLTAAHIGRITVGIIGVIVATTAPGRPTGQRWIDVTITVDAFVWILGLAIIAKPLRELLTKRPGLIWIDTTVLLVLYIADKPWDSLAAIPYAALSLLTPYVRPAAILIATALATIGGYLPKLTLLALGSPDADHVAPISTAEMLTLYIAPLIGGIFVWGTCTLLHQVRGTIRRYENAQDDLLRAEKRRADATARHDLADQLHDAISGAIRAIPLRLDGLPPSGAGVRAVELRSAVSAAALRARPATQELSRQIRGFAARTND